MAVVALFFETDRAPFVVKNSEGGQIQAEIPWRENTSTRSATRSDVLRLIAPLQYLPSFDLLSGYASLRRYQDGSRVLLLHVEVYVSPRTETRIVVPFYRCQSSIQAIGNAGVETVAYDRLSLKPPYGMQYRSQPSSLTIASTDSEILIDGPGRVYVDASQAISEQQFVDDHYVQEVIATISLLPIDAERPMLITCSMRRIASVANQDVERAKWAYAKAS